MQLQRQALGKKIYYLPWASHEVTSITLDGNSPPYFVTSLLSNCRFTMKFHDGEGESVTVMHVAGNITGEGTVVGSRQRDVVESKVDTPTVTHARRLSVGGHKNSGGILVT
jgi:hypothetical protein